MQACSLCKPLSRTGHDSSNADIKEIPHWRWHYTFLWRWRPLLLMTVTAGKRGYLTVVMETSIGVTKDVAPPRRTSLPIGPTRKWGENIDKKKRIAVWSAPYRRLEMYRFFHFRPFFFLRNKKYSWRIVAARGHWLVTQSFGIPAGIGTDTKTRWAASLTGRQRIVHSAGESSSFLINFVSVALFLCRSDYLNLIWSNVRRNRGLCVIATGVSRSEYSKRWK